VIRGNAKLVERPRGASPQTRDAVVVEDLVPADQRQMLELGLREGDVEPRKTLRQNAAGHVDCDAQSARELAQARFRRDLPHAHCSQASSSSGGSGSKKASASVG